MTKHTREHEVIVTEHGAQCLECQTMTPAKVALSYAHSLFNGELYSASMKERLKYLNYKYMNRGPVFIPR